jgi:cytochrome o ubiquinol oxidase subunit IV
MAKHEVQFDVDTGEACGTYKSYIIGFVLSILLTLISFYMVGSGAMSKSALFVTVGVLALVQFFVQVVFFLHLSTHSKSSWNLLSFIFTLVMVLIFIVGTMWIMYNLYENMGMNAMVMS